MSKNPTKEELSANIDMMHSRVIGAVAEFPALRHRFTIDLLKFLGWDRNDFNKFFCDRAKRSMDFSRFIDANPQLEGVETGSIPRITHKIWVTDIERPNFPPEDFTLAYCNNISEFPECWIHVFWSNSQEVIDYIMRYAKEAGVSIMCCMIDSLPNNRPLGLAKSLIADRKYVLSTDILRVVIINHMGGIYSDYGITFRSVIYGIVHRHKYCMVLVSDLFFQSSVIASAPKSDLTSIFLAIISNPEAFDRIYAVGSPELPLKAIDEVETFAGLGWTACIMLFLPPSVAQAYVYSGGEIEWHGLQSWYSGGGKHGNAIISSTNPTIMKNEKYQFYDQIAKSLIFEMRSLDEIFSERISILLKVRDYFTKQPTRFCELVRRYSIETDDTLSKCSYILNYLLWKFVNQDPIMLDLCGTLDSDERAASNRRNFWMEYFCQSKMSNVASNYFNKFDIIIDSYERHVGGDHAGIGLILQLLCKGGYYIIGSIDKESSDLLATFMRRQQFSFVILNNLNGIDIQGSRVMIVESNTNVNQLALEECAGGEPNE